MAFLVAGETAADRVAADIDLLAGLKSGHGDGGSQLEAVYAIDAVFAQVAQRVVAGAGQVPLGWFVDQLAADLAETELHGAIAVAGFTLELGDAAGARFDQGDRNRPAFFIEELGHAQFLPENADGHGKGG